MKNLIILVLALVITFALWSCSEEPISVPLDKISSETVLLKSGPSANGQGTLIMPWGDHQTFSFHARDFDGVVEGSLQFNMHGTNQAHGVIDCMTIEENIATLSGVISNWPEEWEDFLPPPYYFWFRVIDNGEGANDPPDEFSDIYVPIDYFPCDLPIPDGAITMIPIINGNFQVKP